MLGLVASAKRSIKSGSQYDSLFTSTVEGKEVELLSNGDVHDTIRLMKRIVSKTLSQTKALAPKLKGDSREQTCSKIWHFVYNHIQYKKDHPLREQLRTPARTWRDRKRGVDCDCYSIFISSILTNLSIPHAFRMAAYKADFQHVYVVVPASGNKISASRDSYIVVDPVVDKFNYEQPFTKKSDSMSQVTMLNGTPGMGGLAGCSQKPLIDRLITYVPTQQIIAGGGVPTREFLEANGIPFAPATSGEDSRPVYAVCLNSGMTLLPTVLSPEQAAAIKGDAPAAAAPSSSTLPANTSDLVDKAKKNWLWWLLIAAGSWVLFTGSDQSEVKPGLNGTAGLSGVPKAKKSKKKKRAVKAISI